MIFIKVIAIVATAAAVVAAVVGTVITTAVINWFFREGGSGGKESTE